MSEQTTDAPSAAYASAIARPFPELEPVTTETVFCRRLISVPSDLRVGMKVHTLTATDQHHPAAAAPPRPLPVISRLRDRWRRPGSVPVGSSPSTHPDTHTSTGRAQTTAQEIRATGRATVTDKTGRVTPGARVGAPCANASALSSRPYSQPSTSSAARRLSSSARRSTSVRTSMIPARSSRSRRRRSHAAAASTAL